MNENWGQKWKKTFADTRLYNTMSTSLYWNKKLGKFKIWEKIPKSLQIKRLKEICLELK